MDTCFLFTRHLDTQGCFCLKLSSNGELLAPPAQRAFSEIKVLQNDANTLIVESATNTSILDLELPWLAERKARIAIPYALEDKVAQSVEELHFAFDKARYHDNHYLITVIDKQRMNYLMSLLDEHQIAFEIITVDWFALEAHELVINESVLLINNDDFKGALSGELATNFLNKHPLTPVLTFTDSQINSELTASKMDESSYTWLARQLSKAKPLNLCQGALVHGNTTDWIKKGYQLAGLLFGFWLISLLITNAIELYSLNKQTAKIDQQIAVIYHEFFPEAKQVISPKFRISQLLSSEGGDKQNRFWFLLNQLAKEMKGNKISIEQLGYQNKTLSVTLVSPDFATLEDLEKKLKALRVNVKQTQASTRDQQVLATLELT